VEGILPGCGKIAHFLGFEWVFDAQACFRAPGQLTREAVV
jgi:hypothetical protein